jgi:predicted nucleotide-binding protein
LTVTRARAEEVLEKQIEAGSDLLEKGNDVISQSTYSDWREEQSRWRKFTAQALRLIYSNNEPTEEFNRQSGIAFVPLGEQTVGEKLSEDIDDLRRDINTLRSLHERLEFVSAVSGNENAEISKAQPAAAAGETAIFVVHGHDEKIKEKVLRQLEAAGKYPVKVLHEQANQGKTLIEKFEQHASLSGFAVVLLTPDDVGGAVPSGKTVEGSNLRRRARQNVIFELGYFVGAFGRERVAVLHDEQVELPSDYQGIVYIPLSDETWRYRLLKELKAAGFEYDLNKIL